MAYKILGITDAVSTCDCCGKTNLKCAVELENDEGDTVFFGRDCAGAALYGRKNRQNGNAAEFEAKVIGKCRAVLPTVLEMVSAGQDMAAVRKAIGSRFSVTFGTYTDTGNKMPLRIYHEMSSKPGVEISPSSY